MTDKHEHPEGQASEQDQSLEAQLDALLDDLEATEPEMVPKDLRKNKPAEPTPEPQPVAEAKPESGPVSDAELEALVAQATGAQPNPAIKELDPDEIASLASSMLDKQIEDTIATAKPQEAQAPPAQPQSQPAAAAGAEEKPAKMGQDLESIASMASNLLDKQIEDMVAETARKKESEAAGQTPAPADAASAETDAAAGGSDEGGKSLSEDALGDQIQALLNQVQAQPDFGETESDVAPAAAQASAEPAQEQDGADASDAAAVSIDEIDAMLAASAEQAIEQEPEPFSEVPGTDEILAAQALEEDAQSQAAPQPVAQPRAEYEEPEPAPAPAPQPAPATAQPVGATASDVADELDEDDVPAPARPKANQPEHDEALEPAAVVIKLSVLTKAEKTLLRICGKVNRPLNRLSPEMKDTVGYVGIVVLLPALCLILYGLVF